MLWSEVDQQERIWTIPAVRSKNGKAHIVHMSELALQTLATVERRGDAGHVGGGTEPSGSPWRHGGQDQAVAADADRA